MEGAEMELVYHMYMEMSTLLDQFEDDVYNDWCSGLEQICQFNLEQPLINRHPTSGLISVNFNPKVLSNNIKETAKNI